MHCRRNEHKQPGWITLCLKRGPHPATRTHYLRGQANSGPLPGGGGFGAGENMNLQILARQNLCPFLKMSEQIMYASQ